jgi:hypothetical protein
LFDLGFGRLDAYELIEQPPRVEREPTDRHLAVREFFDLVGQGSYYHMQMVIEHSEG